MTPLLAVTILLAVALLAAVAAGIKNARERNAARDESKRGKRQTEQVALACQVHLDRAAELENELAGLRNVAKRAEAAEAAMRIADKRAARAEAFAVQHKAELDQALPSVKNFEAVQREAQGMHVQLSNAVIERDQAAKADAEKASRITALENELKQSRVARSRLHDELNDLKGSIGDTEAEIQKLAEQGNKLVRERHEINALAEQVQKVAERLRHKIGPPPPFVVAPADKGARRG